jgi:hypothetical protein
MNEGKDLTQILNSFGPVHGNVERQIIVTQQPSEETTTRDADQKGVALKVRARVLMELMKRSGMGLDTKDRTKVCRLAALIMGCDYKGLLNTVGEGLRLNSTTHRKDVEQTNRLLDDLEADFRLEF